MWSKISNVKQRNANEHDVTWKTSKEGDLICTLRTQLALQTELSKQYEVDLRARDELVEALGHRLDSSEKEGERRKGILKGWKKKVAELERACRHLEEEVDNSRQESMERSVMDEASGEALRMLHCQIAGLEREKAETERREAALRDEVATLEGLAEVKTILKTRDEEHEVLKGGLNAQWKHMENASERINKLEQEKKALEEERDALKGDVDALEEKIAASEVEWTEAENRIASLEADVQELWGSRETLEKERCELEEQIKNEREHAVNLTQALQGREDRVAELDQERQYALDNVSRLEENIRQRNAEVAEYSRRVIQREAEAERLSEQMSNMTRDHARVVDEQVRALQDTASQEDQTRQHMELLVKEKAAADVEMSTLKDRVAALKDEVERLRRHVHELQQESADKEVKIVQMTKQRTQDKDDMQGLNIALDSKQQELELLKRRLGVRGTGGSTPLPPSKVAHQRRESSAFSTPGMSRPPSAMSDSGKESLFAKDRKPIDTPSTAAKNVALGKSLRANIGSSTVTGKLGRGVDGSMGPPPAKGRVSMGTPTPIGRAPSFEARSSSRAAQPAMPIHRRVSSSMLKTSRSGLPSSPAPGSSKTDEKENLDVSLERRSLIPIPA